jgi:predicted AAA+ superfamily ATPase
MTTRARRGPLLQELTRGNPWWTNVAWAATDPHLAAMRAPFSHVPPVLDDIAPPNLYTLRGPRRAGKSTLIKQTMFGGGLLLTHGAIDLQPDITIVPAAVFAWLLEQPG